MYLIKFNHSIEIKYILCIIKRVNEIMIIWRRFTNILEYKLHYANKYIIYLANTHLRIG